MVTRRHFLARAASVTAAAGICQAAAAAQGRREVPWLRDVLSPPAGAPASSDRLSPILVDSRGRPIATLDAWRRRRAELEQAWRELLGEIAVRRGAAPRVDVIGEDAVGDVVRQHVRYAAEPGEITEAYILRPKAPRGRLPGAVVFHSTTPESIRQPAGLADVPEKHFGLALARRGFVTCCPRNFLWPETGRLAAVEETRRFRQRHPRARGMARMLLDGQVAIDVLAARQDVDAQRIGCIGHSLGAKEALYLAAFDSRVTATVSSEGGIGTAMSNWDADWYLGAVVKQPDFAREHHELLALAAPRPFLLVGGDSADGAASWPWIAAALPVYRLHGEPPRLGLLNHGRGHAVPADVEPRLLEWIETYV